MFLENQHPLILGHENEDPIIWENGRPISRSAFLEIIYALADQLPDFPYVFNLCQSKKFFLFGLAAALIRNQITLLPNNDTTFVLEKMIKDYPDSYCFLDRKNVNFPGEAFQIEKTPLPTNHVKKVPSISNEAIAVIAFTSGSTGTPKSSVKSWKTLVGTSHRLAERFGVFGEDKFTIFSTVPPQHMYGLEASIMLPLQAGAATHASRLFFPEDIRGALSNVPSKRILITTPIHLEVLEKETTEISEVEKIVSATAPLSFELSRSIEEKFETSVHEIYGFTEAGSVATRRTIEGDSWLPLNGYKLINDEPNHSFKIEVPEIPESILIPDIIRLENDGTFTLRGRAEDIIKVGGKRTSLQELNFHLKKAPGVIDGVIFENEDVQKNAHRLVAILELESQASTEEVIQHLRVRIDPVFIPKRFLKVNSLPRDANGKIPREKLVNLLHQEISGNI